MSNSSSNALVPVAHMALPSGGRVSQSDKFELVQEEVILHTREEVRNQLPDILGRALARIWIDPDFHARFASDPKTELARHGVLMPENMSIEYTASNSDRPKIVVFEMATGSKFRMRVFYLQLVMMAGR